MITVLIDFEEQALLDALIFQNRLIDAVLVVLNGLVVTGAEASEKLQKAFVKGLLQAEINQVLNRDLLDLLLQQSWIVPDELMDGCLCKETVLIRANHRLRKEEVDPLGYIDFVHTVTLY